MKARATSLKTAPQDNAALISAIERFRTPHKALSQERHAWPETPRDRLNALLREIDETVLPRRIVIAEAKVKAAELIVSNRRLFGIQNGQNADAKPSAQPLEVLAEMLLEVSKTATAIKTVANRDHASTGESGSGTGVDKLRAALGLDKENGDISHLTGLLAPASLAQITWVDDVAAHEFSGAESWRTLLASHAQRVTQNIAKQQVQKLSPTSGTTGIALPLSEDKVLVIACQDKNGVASVTSKRDGLRAISAWQIAGKTAH